MSNKPAHLGFIQDIIKRMAENSFTLKKWGLTIVIALITVGIKEKEPAILLTTFIPIIIFWILDGFYLSKERLYRKLYDEVSAFEEEEVDYNMKTSKFIGGKSTWIKSMFSKTLNIFYFTLLFLTSLIIVFNK